MALLSSFQYTCTSSRREARCFWCLPPVWNLRAVIWFDLFICLVLLLLSSPFSAFGPISCVNLKSSVALILNYGHSSISCKTCIRISVIQPAFSDMKKSMNESSDMMLSSYTRTWSKHLQHYNVKLFHVGALEPVQVWVMISVKICTSCDKLN